MVGESVRVTSRNQVRMILTQGDTRILVLTTSGVRREGDARPTGEV
jgi:hypothetical protein